MDRQPSSGQAVYRKVKDLILSNQIPGGELLSESQVAEGVGTSRMPVREAFRRLETEGWLRIYPKRGALVLPVSEGEARQLIEARVLLEVHAISSVAARPKRLSQLVASLRAHLEDQVAVKDSGDIVKFGLADAQFHLAIVEAGGNQVLYGLYESLSDRQRRMTSAMLSRHPERMETVIRDHDELVEFIAAGDAEGYRRCALGHLVEEHDIDS